MSLIDDARLTDEEIDALRESHPVWARFYPLLVREVVDAQLAKALCAFAYFLRGKNLPMLTDMATIMEMDMDDAGMKRPEEAS